MKISAKITYGWVNRTKAIRMLTGEQHARATRDRLDIVGKEMERQGKGSLLCRYDESGKLPNDIFIALPNIEEITNKAIAGSVNESKIWSTQHRETHMRRITFYTGTLDEQKRRRAERRGPCIAFDRHELLYQVMMSGGMGLLGTMLHQGPLSIRELARRVKRDVSDVHHDIEIMCKAGVISRTENGFEFPYDGMDFV